MPRPSAPTPLSRRNFLALSSSAAVAGALLGSGLAPSARSAETSAPSAAPAAKKYPIGLELYSVRGELSKDLPNTLRQVAKIGYEVVEFYAPYFSWTFPYAKDVRRQLDDLGLRCYSTHNNFPSLNPGTETMGRAIELNQILGARTIVMASPPPNTKTGEDWKRVCGQLTTSVEQLKTHGLTAGFHNHRIEWAATPEGPRIMDIIAAGTPAEFVLQFDVGTCMEAGADPIAWIKANPGRIKSVHLKDWTPGKKEEEQAYRVLFGEGISPWKEIIATAEAGGGVEYYLLEQEGSRFSEFETAERCLASWQAMRKGR
jgi:sugar phosphate isomerase/epimerase